MSVLISATQPMRNAAYTLDLIEEGVGTHAISVNVMITQKTYTFTNKFNVCF